jgi:hypothetical protein
MSSPYGNAPGYGGYGPPPPARAAIPAPRRPGWKTPVIVIACLLIGFLVGTAAHPSAKPAPSSGTAQTGATPAADPPAPTPVQAAAAPPAPAGPATSVDDGVYEVGAEMAAGKYRSPSSDDEKLCLWERLKENDGSLGDIAQQEVGAGNYTATLKAGEYFKTQGCGTWTKAG